jgi:hypothetical protein
MYLIQIFDLGPYVDIFVKLVLHFFLGIRINVTLVSEKVDCATCNMQLVNKLRRKQCVQTANVIYQSGQKNRSGCIYHSAVSPLENTNLINVILQLSEVIDLI